ncbi:MAG: 6-phosphogluconolactonase, partial [Thermodesulfobacteriales bacterium]
MEKKYYLFEDSAKLAAQLAVDFKDAVSKKATSGGSLTVALSGGHTPKAFFEILAEAPYKEGLPWENVIFFWGDERCV